MLSHTLLLLTSMSGMAHKSSSPPCAIRHSLLSIDGAGVPTLTCCSTPCTHSMLCRGSAQKGPPIENPEPVSLQRSGTGGALAGWYLYPLPFFTCSKHVAR